MSGRSERASGPMRGPAPGLWPGLVLIALALALGIAARLSGHLPGDVEALQAFGRARGSAGLHAPGLWLVVTGLGDWPARVAVALAAAALLVRRHRRRAALVMLLTLLVQTLANSALKWAFGRPRPDLFAHLDHVSDLSYPSGHAAQTACVWLLAALLVDRRLAWAGVPLVVAVGVSRVALGVHWPSDVLGGWLVGAGWALIGWHMAMRPGMGVGRWN
ncbi:phosphatase PAP2 family protein [Sphingomonas changnyeongensis]|uniref:Phosphatase PAP2 family protein n=1 Tax=Sphingomonas changnyeongensis TaxID=2698679 RepID=A0A7Z2S5P4_9SPHN|nr:phosphatase PAP2 family protein [Sphingomonas changnyeongensis]QHL91365.1 phosphatase PAP2 family protein [Sphingomonas changnyeongensis]